jgi:hypothetical protein
MGYPAGRYTPARVRWGPPARARVNVPMMAGRAKPSRPETTHAVTRNEPRHHARRCHVRTRTGYRYPNPKPARACRYAPTSCTCIAIGSTCIVPCAMCTRAYHRVPCAHTHMPNIKRINKCVRIGTHMPTCRTPYPYGGNVPMYPYRTRIRPYGTCGGVWVCVPMWCTHVGVWCMWGYGYGGTRLTGVRA